MGIDLCGCEIFFLECGASPLAPCYDGRGSVGEAIHLSPTRELAVQSAKVSWMCTVGRCGCKPKRLIKILDVVATILGLVGHVCFMIRQDT